MSFLDGKAIRDWCKQRFQSKDDLLRTMETVTENREEGKSVDALVIKEVFQNVSDGKALLASAITDRGVQTDAEDSFMVMAENIRKIQGGDPPTPSETICTISAQPSEKNGALWIGTEDNESVQGGREGEFLLSSTESEKSGALWDENSEGTEDTILGTVDNGKIGNMWIE